MQTWKTRMNRAGAGAKEPSAWESKRPQLKGSWNVVRSAMLTFPPLGGCRVSCESLPLPAGNKIRLSAM